MGFWSSLGSGLAKGAKSALEASQEISQYKAEFENYDDETLKRYARSGDLKKKTAAYSVLKSRGYTAQDLR